MTKDIDFLTRMAKGIATHFGSNCEVVVHDVRKDYENTIIAIENGYISRRQVGDGASEIVLKALKNNATEDQFNYLTKTQDGKILKSTTIFIRDDQEKIVGIISINLNLTDFLLGESAIHSLLLHSSGKDEQKPIEIIPANVHELLDILISEACELIGKPVAVMTKDDKTRAIQYLDSKGAFLIKKSGDKVSEYFDISKYTLYNYLDAPRN